MAGKRRIKKIKSSREIMERSTRAPSVHTPVKEAEVESLRDYLPDELLEKILSRLNLRDNLHASVVCKRWNTSATNVRVVDKSPWLMRTPKSGYIYEFHDPFEHKRHFVEYPELRDSRFSYSKYGWLLVYNEKNKHIFFFCPYTRELINLPNIYLIGETAAFSASPKCPSCVIFVVKNVSPTVVAVSTCHPGATQWTTVNYETTRPFSSTISNKIVFCNNLFYCLSVSGCTGVYNHEENTFVVLSMPLPRFPENLIDETWLLGKFLAENNGDIYFIDGSRATEMPTAFKLDQTNGAWVEMESVGGMTFFVHFLCSQIKTNLLGRMRNSIYFPKARFYGRRSVTYSFDDNRYYPMNLVAHWTHIYPYRSIWIDAPEDVSHFLQSPTITKTRNATKKSMMMMMMMMMMMIMIKEHEKLSSYIQDSHSSFFHYFLL